MRSLMPPTVRRSSPKRSGAAGRPHAGHPQQRDARGRTPVRRLGERPRHRVSRRREATLRALGGDTVLLGHEPDLAKFYESAVGAALLPARSASSPERRPVARVASPPAPTGTSSSPADAKVDHAWLQPLHDLVRKAAAAGHGDDSIAALTEVLGVP
ncbi:hypothetical protein SAMN04515669_2575 [Jiangella sp. DSM 45060]|nr:hypothetical protein SAMN04515669_2575 [Jiangella sp. DSM 45060]